ncbi:MAG: 4-hydroxybenzoate octaprenyltransferase, partial [Plesiomonas shigelloides]
GLLQLATLLLLVLVGVLSQLGSLYYWSLLACAALFVYQQQLLKERERDACFQAFLNNNYVGMVLFCGIASSYLLH